MSSGWGNRGYPLLPASLRKVWASESLPTWVTSPLCLPNGAGYSLLSTDVWSGCHLNELPNPIKGFILNVVRSRFSSICTTRVLEGTWANSVDPALLSWSNRTRHCLSENGLLSDVSRLSILTYGELLRLKAMGLNSVLDFACVAETAIHPHPTSLTSAAVTPADGDLAALLDASEAPWSQQISPLDRRFAPFLSAGKETVFEKLERL